MVLLPATLDQVKHRGIRARCRLEVMAVEHQGSRTAEAMVSRRMDKVQDTERTPMVTEERLLPRGVLVAMVV